MDVLASRARFEEMNCTVIKQGSYSKPEVRCYELGREKVAVKDCSCMHPLLKRFIGRRYQRREVSAYERLKNLDGVPKFKGIIDADAFAVEFVEGATLARKLDRERLLRALKNLEKVIAEIHARKVVHLDLKQKRNVIVRPDDTVAVVDFQSAFTIDRGPLAPLLFNILKKRDLAGLLKFRGKYVQDDLTSAEKRRFIQDRVFARFWIFTHLARFLRKIFKSRA